MLPAKLVNQVRTGKRRRVIDTASDELQLLGRSRKERELDDLYVRQAKYLKEDDVILKLTRGENIIEEPQTSSRPVSSGSSTGSRKQDTVNVANIVKSLMRHVNDASKYGKVLRLTSEFLDQSGSLDEQDKKLLERLFLSVVLSPHAIEPSYREPINEVNGKFSKLLNFGKNCLATFLDDCSSKELSIEYTEASAVVSELVSICDSCLTDDSFVFNRAISNLRSVFEKLPVYSTYSDEPLSSLESSCYSLERVISIVRQLALRHLNRLIEFRSVPWARPALEQTLFSVFLQRDEKFSKEEAKEIENWQALVKAKKSVKKSQPRVLGIDEPTVPIVDARDVTVTASENLSKWAEKQTELGIR